MGKSPATNADMRSTTLDSERYGMIKIGIWKNTED